MRNELADRQQAIRPRLADETMATIQRTLQRSKAWVRKWRHRYLDIGGDGQDPVNWVKVYSSPTQDNGYYP